MRVVGVSDVETNLTGLLDEVAAGRSVVITRRGVPVAGLVPVRWPVAEPREVIAALLDARHGVRLDLSLPGQISEGRC
jgi:prevent-host-death family protein